MERVLHEVRKFVAPEFIFGVDSRLLVAQYARNFSVRNALLVTDKQIIKNGLINDITEMLQKENTSYVIFDSVSPNPRDYEVMEGAEIYRRNNCDFILAVGGGSVIDCAKGIGIVHSNMRNIISFKGVDMVKAPMPPLICVPTTSGSSADVSQFAIINHSEERTKIAIISKTLVPDLSLIDPALLVTMSPFFTATTGMDALVHGIEAYLSNANSHLTNILALDAIKLLSDNLYKTVENGNDLQARTNVMMGSLLAGLAFSNASLGCVHAMAHSLGGYFDLPHGECNAMLLPFVLDYNFIAVPEKYRDIGIAMGLNLAKTQERDLKSIIIDHINQFKIQLNIKNTLKDHGVKSDDIAILAANAIKDPCNATNPRKPVQRDLEIIYSEAL